MNDPLRILIVEDLPTDAELARREISKTLESCMFMQVETEEDYIAALDAFRPDVIISDYRMPRFDGLTALKLALDRTPFTPVIIFTSAMNEDTAVECMKTGATDYVIKEHIKRLGQAVIHALEEKRIREERKRAEEEKAKLELKFLQSQKIESLGRLAGGVAHDFNNMLTVILGHVGLIKGALPGADPLLQHVSEIERAAVHSRDITRQLLAFSRKQVIEPRVIDLNNLITKTQKALVRLIGEDIDFRFFPGPDLWKIRFDPSQVDQILVNLAVNARDAMPDGGSLFVRTANLSIDDRLYEDRPPIAPGEYVLLSMEDSGTGMDGEILSHLFEPFFTTKEVGKGTGLGLATVYGIVEQNHGFIDVISEEGRGATFNIYIPRLEKDAPSAASREEGPAPSRTGSILLVEDNEMVRTMLAAMLETLGHKVITASDPQAAIALCKGATPGIDLLFTDVVMPVMSGRELGEKIRAVMPHIGILYMSGYTSDILTDRGGLGDDVHFVQKPFNADDIARKINDLLPDR